MGHKFTTANRCKFRAGQTGTCFDKLSPAALQDLNSMQCFSSFPANEVLFLEEESPQDIYVILEGEVKLSINSSEGRRLSLSIARKGEILGLASALSGYPYDMTAETLYPVKVAHVGRREFLKFLTRHPEAYQIVVEELSCNVTKSCKQLRTVGLAATARERLARLLLDWSEGGQAMGCGGTRLYFSMTHQEMAEFIGASRETVTRTMTSFKNRQLVAFHGSVLTIPSRQALANYAHA